MYVGFFTLYSLLNKYPFHYIHFFQEFELSLNKVNGSLGFTLRKEDESVLGHYVRALVREPALSDGRIKPGDKIMSVCTIFINMIVTFFGFTNES